jgi:hypothetical protein
VLTSRARFYSPSLTLSRAGDKTPMFSSRTVFPGSHRPSQRCRRGCLASHFSC